MSISYYPTSHYTSKCVFRLFLRFYKLGHSCKCFVGQCYFEFDMKDFIRYFKNIENKYFTVFVK